MQTLSPTPNRLAWAGLALATAAAGTYVLIAQHVLAAGSLRVDQEGGAIVYVAAGCYLVGGLLILLRNRWLLVVGAAMNALVIAFFFSLYQTRPDVIVSPAGLASKLVQLTLEAVLIGLLIVGWKKAC